MRNAAATTVRALLVVGALLVALYAGATSTTTEASSPALVASSTTAVCTTDADCARYSLEHGADGVPLQDDAGEPYCLPGAELYDTEDPTWGDQGVECRPTVPLLQT